MTFFPKLHLACEFEIVEVRGQVSAISVGDSGSAYHGVIKLNNDSARFMFEKLQEGITMPELIKVCMDEYKCPVEEAGPVVIAFLDQLREQKLLAADMKNGIKADLDAFKDKKKPE